MSTTKKMERGSYRCKQDCNDSDGPKRRDTRRRGRVKDSKKVEGSVACQSH